MRPRASGRRAGAAALAAVLGLSGGATGEEATPASPPPAPSCQANGDAAQLADTAALVEMVRRSVARRAPGAEAVEALDNRGYAYGPAPDPLADLPVREPR